MAVHGKSAKDDGGDSYSDAETARRRDDALRRALSTPPQPKQKPSKESRLQPPRAP